MKKALSLLICAIMLVSMTAFGAFAASYEQPFDAYTLDSERFRIPAIYTLNDGSVIAGADIRYSHGSDSPNNIDITVAISKDGYTDWQYNVINYLDDYADGETGEDSASYIDSAIVQSKKTDRIFVLADIYPSGGGWKPSGAETGFVTVDGVQCLLLTDGDYADNINTFKYYLKNGVVYNKADNTATEYTVDAEYRLYKNGEALMMDQKGSEGVEVQQNVFYKDAELSCYLTSYLCVRYSDDNGANWSAPQLISSQVKQKGETFIGTAPGRGIVINLPDGKTERIIFCVYDNTGVIGAHDPIFENASIIYSDDNGVTWHRGAETSAIVGIQKTSESQIVVIGEKDGMPILRMYARNGSNYIAYADSYDGGITWSTFVRDEALQGTKNCMVSFINTSMVIDGKPVILSSAGGNLNSRADGVIRVGLVDGANVEWITKYNINQGFFGYSCLTELSDGNFGLLYEDEAAHIQYMIFSVDEKGNVSEINGNNFDGEIKLTLWQKIVKFFKDFFNDILAFFGIM